MKFRKKPVVVEAWQNTDDPKAMPLWLDDAWRAARVQFAGGGRIDIHTLEGTMRAELGDWIIRGVKGELYPCKPDIFEATYEATYEAAGMNNYERLKVAIEVAAAKEGFKVHNFEYFVSHLDANCVRFHIQRVGLDDKENTQ